MRLQDGLLIAPLLARQKWLRHAFGTRLAAGDPAMAGLPTASLQQIHSDIVHVVAGKVPAGCSTGDAIVTATPGVALAVETADCVPLLLADPENCVVAAVHAGWRGTLRRIAEKTVGVMRREFGADPAKLLAALGPAIHVCCYEVGQEVIEEYRSQFRYADRLFQGLEEENPADVLIPRQVLVDDASFMRPHPASGGPRPWATRPDTQGRGGRARLDLDEAICRQLLEAGLMADHIARGAPCTACGTDLLHSYRKEGTSAPRQLTQIAILPIAECGH